MPSGATSDNYRGNGLGKKSDGSNTFLSLYIDIKKKDEPLGTDKVIVVDGSAHRSQMADSQDATVTRLSNGMEAVAVTDKKTGKTTYSKESLLKVSPAEVPQLVELHEKNLACVKDPSTPLLAPTP
jgi:hypothetical protein